MREFSKEEQDEINGFVTALQEEYTEIDDKIADLMDKVQEVNEKIQRYNNTLKNVRDFRDGHVQRMRDYHADKSETWQNGDEGDAYSAWMDEWEGASFNALELLETPEIDNEEHGSVLDELPLSP